MPLTYGAMEKLIQAVYLKGRIMGRFFHVRITKRCGDMFRELLPSGTVYYIYCASIKRISKKQYLKIRGLHIFVQSRFL